MNPNDRIWLGRVTTLVLFVLVFSAWSFSSPAARPGRPATGTTEKEKDYIIGPEDLLAISVWREPEISRTVPVRPDGKISLPLVGDLEASGLTPPKLQAAIAEKLQAYLAHPEVAVIVQEVRSQRFNIVGEVLRPGSYTLVKPMTVLDAIAVAGGFAEFANVRKVYVLRGKPDGTVARIPFDYKSVIKGRNAYQNVPLEPGDTIVVP